MSSDDLTHNLTNGDEQDKTTQPTITAVFRLLSDLDKRLNGRLDTIEGRLERLETRFDGLENRFDGLEIRFSALETRFSALEARVDALDKRLSNQLDELTREVKSGFLQVADKLERARLHAEADYHDLLRRIRELESKAS